MADVRDADDDLLQQFLVLQRINLVWESLGSSRGHNYVEKEPALYSMEANGFFVQQLPAYVERLASEGGRRVAIFLCDKTYNQPPSCAQLDQILPGLLLRAQTKESCVIGNYVLADASSTRTVRLASQTTNRRAVGAVLRVAQVALGSAKRYRRESTSLRRFAINSGFQTWVGRGTLERRECWVFPF